MRFPKSLPKSLIILSIVADAALIAAAPAIANVPRAMHVRYGDLDLASRSGQRTLRNRLDAAAGRLCADERQLDLAMACRRAVMENVALPAAVNVEAAR